jgi:serine/threonine protein kinase/Tfp pilus assembly protein PilF
MTADDPNARPIRSFAADPASGDPPLDHTRTFSADPAATAHFAVSAPPPLDGPVPGWPPSLTRYQPLHALGGGGMGLVYLCHDRQLDRQVAVKLSGGGRSADRVDVLLREARSAARLHHPNICPVFDAAVSDGVPYLTMAYIDGPTLADELKRCGPCPPDAAARLVRTVAEAMQYAHDQGVVHRDLKPSNILLTPEREPIVTDFGLAVRTDQDTTADGTISGTPHYMAPEQAAGDAAKVGPRSDVFALGVILFEMLVGRPPFDGSAREVLAKVQREAVPPVRKVRKDVPKTLERIVAKATARNPKDRFPNMAAFADALTGFLRQAPPQPKRSRGVLFWVVAVPAMLSLLFVTLSCCIGLTLPAIQKLWAPGVVVHRSGLPTPPTPPVPPGSDPRAAKARVVWVEGEEFLNQGQFDEAIAKLDEAITLDSAADRPRALRAEAYTLAGRYNDAISDIEVLIIRNKADDQWLLRRAELRIRLKRHADAIQDLNYLIDKNPADVPALVARGVVRLGLNELPQAKTDLTRAVQNDPMAAAARYLRGLAKRKLGEEKGAAEDITAALKLDEQVESKLRAKGYIE